LFTTRNPQSIRALVLFHRVEDERDTPHGETALRLGSAAELLGVPMLLLLLGTPLVETPDAATALEDLVALWLEDAAEAPRALNASRRRVWGRESIWDVLVLFSVKGKKTHKEQWRGKGGGRRQRSAASLGK
jgi:hypothetical protein